MLRAASARKPRICALLVALTGVVVAPSCTVDDTLLSGDAKPTPPTIPAGEICQTPDPALLAVRAQPSVVVLPPCDGSDCVTRKVDIIVDPDVCKPRTLSFSSSDPDVAPAPAAQAITLHKASFTIDVKAGAKPGKSTITVSLPTADDGDAAKGAPVTATIDVEVLDPALPACSGNASQDKLSGGQTLKGTAGLTGATIGVQKGAEKPNDNAFLWHVDPFDAKIACADDLTPKGYTALGPAITFGPETLRLNREIPLSIPVNPARMPAAARLRHLRVLYSGPGFKEPRVVPVADARIEKVDGVWALTFKVPRLGTYQAVVANDAGTKTRKRRLTHRAVIGVSMGGGGSAMFGLRHHDLFDVIAPLGGPVDWTWMLSYIADNHLGGFRPIAKGTQLADIPLEKTPCDSNDQCQPDEVCIGAIANPPTPGKCTLMPVAKEPYEHPQTFDDWWYEYPKSGNGGTFGRRDYAQIFRDLALMMGNPNGDNLTKGGENLPAGVPPTDKSVQGDHTGGECSVWVDPLDGPDHDEQQAIADSCPQERCAHTLTLQNYYDDEYNPDGTFPVITVCDGSAQNQALTPYANTWTPEGDDYPLEVGLAVDYNGNGKRDELEPIIRAGHEKWYDDGVDGTPDAMEPGYEAGVNEDPAGDDYDPQYNPTGTEQDHRYEAGEKFDDYGLDGVPGTKQQPPYPIGYQKPGDGYDVGEGDGKFTVSRGLATFWERDAHSIVRGWSTSVPGGPLTDDALARIDLWTDGGTRDLFNFGVDAQHLVGTFAARGRDVAYFTEFAAAPGLDPSKPTQYTPSHVDYRDLQGVVLQRYGHIDPSDTDVQNGSGQHVGTASEIANRLEGALYFIGSRWPEPELRTQQMDAADGPADGAEPCEITGNCTITFTSKDGRSGPVGITLPPGYAQKDLQDRRYPVIYMLHGYGQKPEDLEAAIVFLRNWMNSPTDGMASRLPKAILVYVDGRCRTGKDGKAECIRGSFFTDSVRDDGVKDEQWWLELMDYIDQHYRTMGETTVDWTE